MNTTVNIRNTALKIKALIDMAKARNISKSKLLREGVDDFLEGKASLVPKDVHDTNTSAIFDAESLLAFKALAKAIGLPFDEAMRQVIDHVLAKNNEESTN